MPRNGFQDPSKPLAPMLYGARAVHRCTCYSIERAELQAVLKNHEMDAAFLCRTLSQAAHEAMALCICRWRRVTAGSKP